MVFDINEFHGRKVSFIQMKDSQGKLWLCPSDCVDHSACVSEDMVDFTYPRGG